MKEAQADLNKKKDVLKACNKDIQTHLTEQRNLLKENDAAELEGQELEHKITKCNKDSKEAAKTVNNTEVSHHAQILSYNLIQEVLDYC